jgi:hypothetical protein
MSFRQPTQEEVSTLERLVKSPPPGTDEYHTLNPNLRHYTFYQSTTPMYGEWLFARMQTPMVRDVPSFSIGGSTMGVYFPGAHEIWMNTDERYAGMTYGHTLQHEKNHSHTPIYSFSDPSQTEAENRWRTYRETGDHSQLGPWAYR